MADAAPATPPAKPEPSIDEERDPEGPAVGPGGRRKKGMRINRDVESRRNFSDLRL